MSAGAPTYLFRGLSQAVETVHLHPFSNLARGEPLRHRCSAAHRERQTTHKSEKFPFNFFLTVTETKRSINQKVIKKKQLLNLKTAYNHMRLQPRLLAECSNGHLSLTQSDFQRAFGQEEHGSRVLYSPCSIMWPD